MSAPKTLSDLQSYIDNQVEERIDLDYKRADSLGKTNGKKTEITKDVSAMANAAGGIIIYGIAEYADPDKKHLADKLDPIDRNQYTREWLDQVIGNIRPKIDGLIITPVSLRTGSNDTAYVIEIPQATTAHQARDGRYYKRFNFTSEWMLDHEIRDVMSRAIHPVVNLSFTIRVKSKTFSSIGVLGPPQKEVVPWPVFEIIAHNTGSCLAQYVTCWVKTPVDTLEELPHNCEESEGVLADSTLCTVLCLTNRTRDVVGWSGFPQSPLHSEPYFNPILPSLDLELAEIDIIIDHFQGLIKNSGYIEWELQADNAPRKRERIKISDIPVIWEYERKQAKTEQDEEGRE